MSSRLHKQQNLELFHHVVGKNSADIALVLDAVRRTWRRRAERIAAARIPL